MVMKNYISMVMLLVISGVFPVVPGLLGQTFHVKNEIVLKTEEDLARVVKDIRSPDTVLMTKKVNNNMVEIYLEDLLSNEKEVIDQVNTEKGVYAELSSDKKFAAYAYHDLKKKKWISKVYNLKTGEVTVLEHEIGDVGNLSVSPRNGAILYEVRERGEVPEIYMSGGDGTGARLVTHGMGATWSPDGRWFIFKPMNENNVHPKQKYLKGKITKEEMKKETEERRRKAGSGEPMGLPLYVFDSKGNKQIELKEFGGTHGEFKWSPNSNKLAFIGTDRTLSSIGLYIVDLVIIDDQIVDNRDISISYNGYYPDWSPDGQYLAFTKITETEDHHNIANKDICIVHADGSNLQNITNTPHIWEEKPNWTPDGNLIISRGNELVMLEIEIE
jgi:tricorn protease-like protein